ncbi:tRNA adenosine deaminase-associated protein [Corynebacterium diphtheriae bv. mitis]|uniref:tRNA adenosine deaminase-associated protein n=1 Tax=Corynebacterium diphtheriae TaxID=1717 RepID=UPI0008FAEFC7|nr:tRNA adenosine deaminase-associated protein [Corynebacterium diphtheriae]MBG9277828.1 tRNA adenosine deaminase-associated protein [Corynebacterium diphtheriae bv. mitis]MBG9282273.1 tRNA adenosine deaminase-associated protein [Corynebacterium diphtheriae bv. mitis]OIS02426.1 tRNA adenosine deaminase [Corynebacterium diphtheriae]CAB0786861.1 tRNA adenosine deaminase-associated protein [Corynebacterium diphtheriae]CAB0854120.1 tRNA adenosine deaminase-associated protein [Corynebacterium dipht
MKSNFAVTVARVNATWQVRAFNDDYSSLERSIDAVRTLRAEGAAFAMLSIEDDYFVLVRPTPQGVKLLISDATAATEDDFAADILDELDADQPDPEDTPYAEGDFDILADLGLSEQIMSIITDETDWWASEQLQRIAEELGFDDELEQAL